MSKLAGKVALVTGASRGVGKGVALGLAEAGATVYVTGRTLEDGQATIPLEGSLRQTVKEIEALGAKGIAIQCDHRDDEQTRAVFAQIEAEQHRLDILVNNVWGGYEHFCNGTQFWLEKGFWDAPMSRWDSMFSAGIRAHYHCSCLAAPMMIRQKSGLIVNISFFAADSDSGGVAYGVAKASSNRMAACMAHELCQHHVAAVSLYPGLVRTEGVMRAKDHFDLSNSESPQFIGRAVAHLAGDPELMSLSGQVLVAAELATKYGYTDIDGKQPRSVRAEYARPKTETHSK